MKTTTAPNIILSCCFIISIGLMWPGIVSPDAMGQYNDAIRGVFNDHHPPLMGYVWRFLDYIYPGSGLLLFFHLLMLYGAAAIFIYIFRNSKFRWWYAIYPLVPNILAYTPLIAKDLGFSFSYLLTGAIIALLNNEKIEKFKWLWIILAVALLFYGSCVKYQARFILPFFCFGLMYCALSYRFNWRTFFAGLALFLLILQAMFSFNDWLVPTARKSHSWQLVKLYDLAAISIDKDKPMFPQFILEQQHFSFSRIKKSFVTSEVDPLVFGKDPVLHGGDNKQQRDELLTYWRDTIKHNFASYIKIRTKLWFCNLISTPSSRNNPADFIKDTKLLGSIVTKPKIYSAIGKGFVKFKVLLQFLWISPLPFIYAFIAWRKMKTINEAIPLLVFNLSSICLLAILFSFSMAATARYIFICICLVHASHGFVYRCLTKRQL